MKYILPVLPLKRSLKLTMAAVGIIVSSLYFWVTVPAQAAAGINTTINFQGKLVDDNGLNVADSTYTVVFTLYDDPSAGSNLWDETQSVTTTDGLFQVALGSVDTTLANVNFNSDNLYLGIKVGSDSEMTPRIRFAAVPYAFNAQKVAGLTVTNTTGTLTIPNGKTIQFGDSFTTSGANALTLTTTGTTNITLPTTGTLLTNTASSNQTFTSTQTSGTVLGIIDSTGLTGNITGMAITLSGSGAHDQTGLSFNLSNSSGSNLNDIVGTGNSWKVSRDGALTVASCAGCGGNGYLRLSEGALSPVNDTIDFLFGGAASISAEFKLSPSGTSPTASVAAKTSYAGLVVDNTLGDILAASSSGKTRFVIKNNGNIGLDNATYANCGTLATDASGLLECSQAAGNGEDLLQGSTTLSNTTLTTSVALIGTVSVTPTTTSGDVWVQANLWTRSVSATDQTITWELRDGSNCSGSVLHSTTSLLNSASGANGPAGFLAYIETNPGTTAQTYAVCGTTTVVNGANAGGLATATVIDANAASPGSGENYLRLQDGAYSLINDTADFLFGNIASSAAKFKLSSSGTTSTASVTATSSYAGLIVDNTLGDLFTASSSGMSRFVIQNNGNVGIGTTLPTALLDVAGAASLSAQLSFRAGAGVIQTTANNTLTLGGSTTGNIFLQPLNGFGRVGVNSANPLASFDVRGSSGTIPVASFSGQSAFAGMVVDNSGRGDVFAASTSGLGRFVIKQNGDVAIGTSAIGSTDNYGNAQNILNNLLVSGAVQAGIQGDRGTVVLLPGSSPTASGYVAFYDINGSSRGSIRGDSDGLTIDGAGNNIIVDSGSLQVTNLTAGSCDVKASVTGVLSCGTDATGGGSGTNYLNLANGAFSFVNNTADFLIGGTATSSAKFAFGGLNTNTPVATFSGDLIINNRPTTSADDMQRWVQNTGTAGTIGGGATTAIASISASVVYNGSLYVGTNKANQAEVYRYNGGSSWTKVTNATAGTITTSGTANIDMVSAMMVHNGYLYIGTTEPNGAEVYRFDGGTTWTKVSQAAGTIRGGGGTPTTLIDGISSMGVHGGKLHVGTADPARAEIYRYDGGTTWIVLNSTPGTFITTNTAIVDAVNSLVSYNGTLYFTTKKNNDADLVRYTGVPGTGFLAMNAAGTTGSYGVYNTETGAVANVTGFDEALLTVHAGKLVVALSSFGSGAEILVFNPNELVTTVNTFIRLNAAAGQIATGGTTNIDSISAMTLYNGRLYVGTTETNAAEIYRFEGGTGAWTKISQNTAGRISHGGTTAIDSIATLIAFNHNSLFAGTREGTTAEGFTYQSSIDQSYALRFNAAGSQAGGEQNSQENLASIHFVASLSANMTNKQGNTGAFVFTHGILTNNGSYDVAEDYPTRDETLEPGDVVSIDTNERGFIQKSREQYDPAVIGIYSESPALRLSQNERIINGGRAVPIALAGRVPVKVTTENGDIEPGDALSASSIPGVAMKATKSGVVIGQAMSGYDGEDVGKVLAYIKSSSYSGNIADAFASIDINAPSSGKAILAALQNQTPSAGKSELVTDRVIAGLELVSPKITADVIIAKKIEADEFVLTAEGWNKLLASGGLDLIDARFTAQEARMDNLENLFASASAKATEDAAQRPESSSIPTDEFSMNNLSVAGLATVSANLRVKGNSLIEGILNVVDTLTVGNFIVNRMANFFGDVIFHSDVVFRGRPTFNNDTAGVAVIKKGSDRVEVRFGEEYKETPVVSANLVLGQITKAPSQSDEDLENVQNGLERKILDEGLRYVVTRRTEKGFTIMLKEPAAQDLTFSWTALATEKQSMTEGSAPAKAAATDDDFDSPKQEDRIEPAVRAQEDEEAGQEGGDNNDST